MPSSSYLLFVCGWDKTHGVGRAKKEQRRGCQSSPWAETVADPRGCRRTAMSDTTDDEVFFVYTTGVVRVPDDVVRVLVDPSVMSIPANAFCRRTNLAEVEL